MDNKFSTIKERVIYLIEYHGDIKEKFFEKIGMTYGNFKGPAKKTPLNSSAVVNILSIYKDINPEWLLTGNGDMLKLQNNSENKSAIQNKYLNGIPLIPTSAMAGFFSGSTQILEFECDRFVVPVFKDAEFLIQVKGSSMVPKYNSGDIVACKRMPIDTFFQWNKVYVLDTEQGALIKRIQKGETPETLSIVSENPNYPPFELHRSKIYNIALVIGVIRLE